MEYTKIVLGLLGLLGILLHNLVEMNKINKASDGNINIVKYFKVEVFSILISVIVVIVSVLISQEIKQLEQVGKWLGLGFMAIGYMGQSLLIALMGKAVNVVEKTTDTKITDNSANKQ